MCVDVCGSKLISVYTHDAVGNLAVLPPSRLSVPKTSHVHEDKRCANKPYETSLELF